MCGGTCGGTGPIDTGFVVCQNILESDIGVGHHRVIFLWVEDFDEFGGAFTHFE